MADATEIVSEYWGEDRNTGRIHSWLQHPVMRDFLHRRITGNSSLGTLQWFKRQFFPQPAEICLSLGCGFGEFDRGAISLEIAHKFEAFDMASAAVESARQAAASAGIGDRISYGVRNLDELELPPNRYDGIFAISSVHHIYALENYFRQCRRALKPGALLFLDEYIGPSRFQSSPFVTQLINDLLAIFPERYRLNVLNNDGSVVENYVPSTVDHFEKVDPSEAIRSGELVNTLKMYFDLVEYRPYGGALLHMLFSRIMGNFDAANEMDVSLLRVLATMEEALEKAGALQSDFAVIVAKPRITS